MAIGNPITLTNNVASKIISVTATADQTAFTVTGGYRINQLAVFRNGVRLSQSSDYTANDGATVTLVTPANLNDNLEFQIFDDFRVAGAIQADVSTQTISGELNVTGGINIGIQSASTNITTGVITALNFVGAGNTLEYNSSTKTVDISIAGGAGAGGTWANYDSNAGVSTTKKVKIENDLEVTGVATATQFSGDIVGVAATFSGDVIVGGTLSYEDVTNIDSVGIITAQSGIRIGAGQSIGSDGADAVFYGDGSNLTGVISGVELQFNGSSVGSAVTNVNFVGFTSVTAPDSAGLSTVTGWEVRDTWLYGGG